MRSLKQSLSVMTLILTALYFSSCAIPASDDNKAAPAASASASPTDQAAAPRQRYLVTETRVKSGMGPAFVEFTKKETIPAYLKAGVKELGYYSRATLGEGGEYVSIRPIASLKELDEPNPIVKALGEDGARAFNARRAQMVESGRNYLMEERPELGIEMKPGEPQKLVFVTRSLIAPGRAEDYENWIRNDSLPLIKKAGPKGYAVSRVRLGGSGNEYHNVVFADSFADYQRWTEGLQGFSKIAQKLAGIVNRSESSVYRFMPELSLPQPTVAQNK